MFINRIFPVLFSFAIVTSAAVAGEPLDIEGVIARATIGGVETPRRDAFSIGQRSFLVQGPMTPAVAATVGQRLALRGFVYYRMAVGAEALPAFIVGEMALARADVDASPVRILGNVRSDRVTASIAGRQFVPAGPLAPALLALEGLEVEVTAEKAPSVNGVEGLFVTSIAKRDITKGHPELLLEQVTEDAIGRYSASNPASPEGTSDGTSPRVKSASFDEATGRYTVVVETFGGIAGISLGQEVTYVYDAQGKLVA